MPKFENQQPCPTVSTEHGLRQRFRCICFLSLFILILVICKQMGKLQLFKSLQTTNLQNHPPLLSEKDIQKVYTFNNKWEASNICKPYSAFEQNDDFHLTKYTSKAGRISIFIHNPSRDFVSGEIKAKGAFDVHLINRVVDELREDLDINVIDIGTNVGQFCLATALLGRHCIGIDAVESNIQHVCASTEYENFGSKITLIHNALSDKHEQIDIRYNVKGNFGAIFVDADNIRDLKRQSWAYERDKGRSVKTNTVKLDDLLNLQEISIFEKVFLKMDVEGFEHRVLLGAEKFFRQIDVRGIIMEWKWHARRKSSATIKRLLSKWGFVPYELDNNNPLDLEQSDKWPHDLVWYPYSRHLDLLD